MAIEIERGIPIPSIRLNNSYPWEAMEVADSFVVPVEKEQSIRRLVVSRAAKDGRKYSCRKLEDGSIRVWRVA